MWYSYKCTRFTYHQASARKICLRLTLFCIFFSCTLILHFWLSLNSIQRQFYVFLEYFVCSETLVDMHGMCVRAVIVKLYLIQFHTNVMCAHSLCKLQSQRTDSRALDCWLVFDPRYAVPILCSYAIYSTSYLYTNIYSFR